MLELEEIDSVRKAQMSRESRLPEALHQHGAMMNKQTWKRSDADIAEVLTNPGLPSAFFPSQRPFGLLRSLPTAPPKMIPLGSSLSAGHERWFFAAWFP